jgi:hypothetical protein
MSLQTSSSLVSTMGWKTFASVPVVNSNQLEVALTATNPEAYFRLGPEIDATTLNRKLLMGYQGQNQEHHQQSEIFAAYGQTGGGHLGLRLYRPARHAAGRSNGY